MTIASCSTIDTATNKVIGSPTSPGPANGIAVTPDSSHAYVADWKSRTIVVITTWRS